MSNTIFVPLTEEPPVTADTQPKRGRDWYKQLRWQVELEAPVSLIASRRTFTAVCQIRTIDGQTERDTFACDERGWRIWASYGHGHNAQEAIADLVEQLSRFNMPGM